MINFINVYKVKPAAYIKLNGKILKDFLLRLGERRNAKSYQFCQYFIEDSSLYIVYIENSRVSSILKRSHFHAGALTAPSKDAWCDWQLLANVIFNMTSRSKGHVATALPSLL